MKRILTTSLVLLVGALAWFGCGNKSDNIKPVRPFDSFAIIPEPPGYAEEIAVDEARASALRLLVDVTEDSELRLNGERQDPESGTPYGSVNNPGGLTAKLTKVLQDRDAHPGPDVYKSGTEIVQKTVFIKAPESLKYGVVVKVIDAVKAAGASPIGLQVDGLAPETDVPQETRSVNDPWDWKLPGIKIPKETSTERPDRPLSSKDFIVISIVRDGEFYLSDSSYNFDLKARDHPERKRLMRDVKAAVAKRAGDDETVYIKASVDISYGQVVGIINLVRRPEAGGVTQVGLVADRKRSIKNGSVPD